MKTGFIHINDNVFETLLAVSSDEQTKGLMGKAWPPPIMSFVYDKPQINKFWMYNTPSPLDIIFCHGGVISQIHQGQPFSTTSVGADDKSDLVVEFPSGVAEGMKMKVGDKIKLVIP